MSSRRGWAPSGSAEAEKRRVSGAATRPRRRSGSPCPFFGRPPSASDRTARRSVRPPPSCCGRRSRTRSWAGARRGRRSRRNRNTPTCPDTGAVLHFGFHRTQLGLVASAEVDRPFAGRGANLQDEHGLIGPCAGLRERSIGGRIHIDVGKRRRPRRCARCGRRRRRRRVGHTEPGAEKDPLTKVGRPDQLAAAGVVQRRRRR